MPLAANGAGSSRVPDHGSADDRSAPGRSVHHVRTPAGAVSLSWDPGLGVFVAARGQQTWSDGGLGALARTAGISVPAPVARELWRDQRLHPAMRVQGRPAVTQAPAGPVTAVADLSTPAGQAEVPAGVEATPGGAAPGGADARHDLIEDLGSVLHGLAGGEPVDQVLTTVRGRACLVEFLLAAAETREFIGVVRQLDGTHERPWHGATSSECQCRRPAGITDQPTQICSCHGRSV
jgi:hypothetical protein